MSYTRSAPPWLWGAFLLAATLIAGCGSSTDKPSTADEDEQELAVFGTARWDEARFER